VAGESAAITSLGNGRRTACTSITKGVLFHGSL